VSAADRNAALLLVVHGIDSVDPFIVPAGWEPEPNDLQDPPRVDAPPELKAALQRRFQQELAAASQVAAITWPGGVATAVAPAAAVHPHLQLTANPDEVAAAARHLAQGHGRVKVTGFSRFDCVALAAADLHERGWEADITPTALPATDGSYPAG